MKCIKTALLNYSSRYIKRYKIQILLILYIVITVLACNFDRKGQSHSLKTNENCFYVISTDSTYHHYTYGIGINGGKLHSIGEQYKIFLKSGSFFSKNKIKLIIKGTAALKNYSTFSGHANGIIDSTPFKNEQVTGYVRIEKDSGYIGLIICKLNTEINIYSTKISSRFKKYNCENYDKRLYISVDNFIYTGSTIKGKIKVENRNPETVFTDDQSFRVLVKTNDEKIFTTVNLFDCIDPISTKFADIAIMPDSFVLINFEGETSGMVNKNNLELFSVRNYINCVGYISSDWLKFQ